jgi:hypothetical protein
MEEADALFTRALRQAEASGLRLAQIRALHQLGTIDAITIAGVDRLLHARALAEEVGAVAIVADVDLQLGVLHAMRWELDRSAAASERAIVAARRYHLGLLEQAAMIVAAVVPATRSDRPQAERAVAEALAVAPDANQEAIAHGIVLAIAALADEDRDGAILHLSRGEALIPEGSSMAQSPMAGVHIVLKAMAGQGGGPRVGGVEVASAAVNPFGAACARVASAISAGRSANPTAAAREFGSATAGLRRAPWMHRLVLRLAAEAAIRDGWGEPVGWLRDAHAFFEAAGNDSLTAACRSLLAAAGTHP